VREPEPFSETQQRLKVVAHTLNKNLYEAPPPIQASANGARPTVRVAGEGERSPRDKAYYQ